MTQVQVTRKELSNGLQAILVTIDGVEGMTLPELAKLLGVGRNTLANHIARYSLASITPSDQTGKQLRMQGAISITGRAPNFLPQSTIEALVKLVGTPEAWEIYGQIWGVVKAVHSGDFIQAGLDVGLTEDDLLTNFEACLNLLKKTRAERDQARGELKKTKGFAVTNVITHGLKSSDVYNQYPAKSDMLIEETKPHVTDVDKFVPTGILTIGLKRNGLKTKVWTANKAGTPVKVFNADEVHAFMSTYKEEAK